ncbi:Brp/Blh family beta-carotene 15,15'-dioxygenase [Corallococcus aberystwythensis]|uniref:Brp/Blh family beta-carotene 15,15'-dioxygenase n=1 Tax=Corallococcus aberystwythensis TaxID=2316722 RepID=UPI0013159819|nr:Brp/Blh family beta-carotene 15,15'-dioxygenase [Corallococcus aberystwythensis]
MGGGLLVALACYFGGWRAERSLRSIHRSLGRASRIQVWMKALLFTALTRGGLGLLAVICPFTGRTADPRPVMFIFLAVLTLPHPRVLCGLNRRLE